MLHDAVMSRINGPRQPGSCNAAGEEISAIEACLDRRESDRLPFPAEMVIVWNHDLGTSLRFRVLDAGDGGYRIRTSVPVLEGTTGMVLRMLPGRGQPLDQPVMVAWIRPSDDAAGFDVGLRCF